MMGFRCCFVCGGEGTQTIPDSDIARVAANLGIPRSGDKVCDDCARMCAVCGNPGYACRCR